ncbi:uncharacterized protein LOC144032178 [Festucalex cinctus]
MKPRLLGNSATLLRTIVKDAHYSEWMSRATVYLSILTQHGLTAALPPPMRPIPHVAWFQAVYVRDVLPCLQDNKARLTSIFGSILKMDSTKKMTKKLTGKAAGTAAWVTNVGNEHGQVLMSVLTAMEGEGLSSMIDGLVRRYREAGQPPPKVLYVDRDCCALTGQSKVASAFGEWDQLVVRLDIWHLMRRFARGVRTDAHVLYGPFMSRLALAIFEWDAGDVERLRRAKQGQAGEGAFISLKSRELERHCRRRTRSEEEIARLIQEVLDHFWEVKDTLGNLLLDHGLMTNIWTTQRRHLACILDPPGVTLYTQTGEVTVGGVKLPVFRCARGSTSLESFHLHQCRFIPSTSANALHFQVYLMEGLTRWNEDRARAAVVGGRRDVDRCYNSRVVDGFQQVLQAHNITSPLHTYTPPGTYTGELIGVEYLRAQTGATLLKASLAADEEDSADWQDQVEEGYQSAEEEEEEEEEEEQELEYLRLLAMSVDSQGQQQVQPGQPAVEEEDVEGPDGKGGYQFVVRLAYALVELRNKGYVTQGQVAKIKALWQQLHEHDKAPPAPLPPRKQPLVQGRFKSRASRGTHLGSEETAKRLFIGKGTEAAHSPSASRLVEAVFIRLCNVHSQNKSLCGVRMSRWGLVLRDYSHIRDLCRSRPLVTAAPIQLVAVNHRTLTQWHHNRSKDLYVTGVCESLPAPSGDMSAADALPAARPLLDQPGPSREGRLFEHPEDTSGMAKTLRGPVLPDLYAARMKSAATCVSAAASVSATAASTTAASTATSTTTAPAPSSTQKRLVNVTPRVQQRKVAHFLCKSCGNPKTKEFGHSRYRNEHFCSQAAGRSVDDWLDEKRSQDTTRKSQPQPPTQPIPKPARLQRMTAVSAEGAPLPPKRAPTTTTTTSHLRSLLPAPRSSPQ